MPTDRPLLRSPRPSPRRPATAFTLSALTATALLAPMAAPAAADTADGVEDLRKDIDALLDDPALEGATSGVLVGSLDTGDVLYGRDDAVPLIPASNTKLLTSAAALDVLDTDHTFSTTVSASEEPVGGVVIGDLYLTGTGDPSLTSDAFDRLAADVADSGVSEVTGDLLADDTWFDSERLPEDWETEDEPYYYGAQISALTVAANEDLDTGVVNVTAAPGETEDEPVDVRLAPAGDNLDLTNNASTGPPGSASTVDVTRELGTNRFTAAGSLPAGGEDFRTLRTVHEPTDHAAHLFADSLEDNGVKVHGGVDRGTEPEGAEELAGRESAELGDLLVPLMKLSNNGHAEILVKSMGREAAGEGGWKTGLAEVEAALGRIGVDLEEGELHDGSGLARTNLLTAGTVTGVLEAVRGEPWAEVWTESLPVAGAEDRMVGGTLSQRMRGTAAEGNVRAKTGTLSGVSALSGYVTGADGEELVFAIINNDYESAAPRDLQDAIAVRLAEFSRDSGAGVQREPLPLNAPDDGLECTWAETC
ncbi:D-alanyl-D-alanine carboxypeptidase/D-alanyl-D-alanine endopeptidase [Allosalinactinospora lopnorensis]|uniref:D-alanyl-D-alanine carboxypeptidase/D-alanyl-D-alanine endopeptidase n=1 Tax=Allosalinactinospora lopnorensis TaxID=1352348 RepID=UPI0009E32031|nr:D-alanyl-D-alanine carboxypeptidase/D-alanyl-D-alanine-endopeptidase [Allosalinactinospora lopnorensis]